MGIFHHKIPPLYCFCCIRYMLVSCIFIFVSKIIFNLLISYLTQWSFKSMSFSSRGHRFFYFLLLLISSYILLWLERYFGMISIFLNLLWLVLYITWSILEMFHALQKNVFFCCWVESFVYICDVHLVCIRLGQLVYFLSGYSIHYWKWIIEIYYKCIAVTFSFQICKYIYLHILRCSDVWCIYLYLQYIHFELTLLSLYIDLCL